MRCQPIGLVNLAVHAAFAGVWAVDTMQLAKANSTNDNEKIRDFMIVGIDGRKV